MRHPPTTESTKYAWAPALSIYLGKPEEAGPRRERLTAIAKSFGLSTSALVKGISDGTLLVVHAPPKQAPQARTEAVVGK